MRTERIEMLNGRDRVPLVVRSRFERTFFGLGLFAAVNLFLWGAYLLTEAIRDPLRATGIAVLVAGFFLALASFLMAFLLWPKGRRALARDEEPDDDFDCTSGPVLTVYGQTVQDQPKAKLALREGKNLPGPM